MSLTLPPGFLAVGIRNGRQQVTNRGVDQSFVFAMLKAIPEAQGGARQQLAGEGVPMLGNGSCSEFLADLITRFQRNQPSLSSKDGVVDPGGATLQLMMRLAGATGGAPSVPRPSGGGVPNTESALPSARLRLLQACANATRASGGQPRKPTAEELRGFFATARTEAVPTLAQAQRSLATLGGGCYIQGNEVRHWCGIYACALAVGAGFLNFRWSLMGGNLLGPPKVWGHQDILPGDIAVIAAYSHHFFVTSFPAGGKVQTLEGNTSGQMIRRSEKKLGDIVAFFRTVPL
jgi:hypothetical protein